MKRVGGFLIILGIALIVYSMMADVSVAGLGERRISNLGLMHDRLINLIFGGFVFLVGLVMRILGVKIGRGAVGVLDAIDDADGEKIWMVSAFSILMTGVLWSTLTAHIWGPPLMLMFFGVVFWFVLVRSSNAFRGMKFAAAGGLVFTIGLMAWHVLSVMLNYINLFTFLFVESMGDYLNTPSIYFGIFVFYVVPTICLLIAYIYISKRGRVVLIK
jgi:hypothetical protein